MLISVATIAIVAAGVMFVPTFRTGVSDLGTDVQRILKTHKIGDPTDATKQGEPDKAVNVDIAFDGMLENVGGKKSAALVFMAFFIAGAMWAMKNGKNLSADKRAAANDALQAYAANGGTEDEIHRAYRNIDMHNGDVAKAYQVRNGEFSKGVYRPGDDSFRVIDSNGDTINKGGNGTQSA